MALASNYKAKPKRDKPFCSHYGMQGHTIDKCYKFHRYPPSYNPKPKFTTTKAHVNRAASTMNEGSALSEISLNLLTPS